MGSIILGVIRRAGDAFTSFYATYLLTILQILTRIGVRKSDVPDLSQRVFLKIHRNFEKVPTERVESWLEMICKQQAAEHYRLFRNRFERPEPNVGVEIPGEDDVHAQLERIEADELVKRVLASMDPKLADVLIRHEIEGESLEQIAETLGIARNTAQARLAKARVSFRRRAEKLFGRDRAALLLLPFGVETFLAERDLSPGFVEEVRARAIVQRGVKQWLGQMVMEPLFMLGAGALGGVTGALAWPRDVPSVVRAASSIVVPVVVLESASVIPTLPGTASAMHSAASPTPQNDRETTNLERARGLITQGKYAEALVVLTQHERDFPRSQHAAARSRYVTLAQEGLRRAGSP